MNIVTLIDKKINVWNSGLGWTVDLSQAESFDQDDVDFLLNHFYKNNRIASAVDHIDNVTGFALTGDAIIS